MFAPNQVEMLEASLDTGRIAHRKKQGQTLSYLEGFDVIEAANAIFGYDGWGYIVTRLDQVGTVWYATVRVTVNAGGDLVEREDVGVGIPAAKAGETPSAESVETAIKASLTDSLKRALRTFGDQFGNGLYDKDAPEHEAGHDAAPGETNATEQPARPTVSREHGGETRACPTCQKPMLWKEGVSKAGKTYAGWFCSDRSCAQKPLFGDAHAAPTPLRVVQPEPAAVTTASARVVSQPAPTAADVRPLGEYGGPRCAAAVRVALTQQGFSAEEAQDWITARLIELDRDFTRLTVAEGQALVARANDAAAEAEEAAAAGAHEGSN